MYRNKKKPAVPAQSSILGKRSINDDDDIVCLDVKKGGSQNPASNINAKKTYQKFKAPSHLSPPTSKFGGHSVKQAPDNVKKESQKDVYDKFNKASRAFKPSPSSHVSPIHDDEDDIVCLDIKGSQNPARSNAKKMYQKFKPPSHLSPPTPKFGGHSVKPAPEEFKPFEHLLHKSTFAGDYGENATKESQDPPASNTDDMHGKFKAFLKDNRLDFDDESALDRIDVDTMYSVLRGKFGFNAFRHCQKQVIIAALLKKNCCVLMPTGAGKSLCYQLSAMVGKGLTVVISPLVSLMVDQVAKLKNLDIKAACFRGDTTIEERESILDDLNGSVYLKLLYVAPEMLSRSNALLGALQRVDRNGKLVRIVVDEAHCISSWGHDFRPEYSKLPELFVGIKGVPIMALTATATPEVVMDIIGSLKLENPAFFISSFVRNNLKYMIRPKSENEFRNIITLIKKNYSKESGIIYCLSRNDCEKVCDQLKHAGLSAAVYHAKLPNIVRQDAQSDWMRGKVKIICATVAFGMGIDKPDVRFIIHHSMPSSIEGYYQETGRAGRDGFPSLCILLYAFSDHVRYLVMNKDSKASPTVHQHRLESLYQMVAYCEDVSTCKRKLLVEHFGEFYDANACLKSTCPCQHCNEKHQNCYKAYDFTEEAIAILESVKALKTCAIGDLCLLYRGKNLKNANKAEAGKKSKMYNRGEGAREDDINRLMRKLVLDGYLTERIFKLDVGMKQIDVCTLEISRKGEAFISHKDESKFYSFLSTTQNKEPVSQKVVLMEKFKLKNLAVSDRAREDLKNLLTEIATEQGIDNQFNIISSEGIQQLAALLPRTRTEIVDIESMTEEKYDLYGSRITSVLKKYWDELDRAEHEQIKKTVGKL